MMLNYALHTIVCMIENNRDLVSNVFLRRWWEELCLRNCFFYSKFSIIFFWKKMKFWDNSLNLYYFGEKIRSRRHLSHLSKFTNRFLKNMSKFRANNHFWFGFIFSLIFYFFAMKSIDFLYWKIPKE